jgi:hypothetical protein
MSVDAVLATMTTARIHHLPMIEDNDLKGIGGYRRSGETSPRREGAGSERSS